MVRLIVAIDRQRGLANDSGIPWQGQIPGDAAYFREQTSSGVVLMGFRTYQEFDRPLHRSTNFVLARIGSEPLRPGFIPVIDLDKFMAGRTGETVWVIGGGAIYAQTMPIADELFVTQLDQNFDCTKFFPEFKSQFFLASSSESRSESAISYRFEVWRRQHEPSAGEAA
jgi:dihydrofolate reductase